MVELRDIALISVLGYKYYFDKAMSDKNYIEHYEMAEDFLSSKIFNILPLEEQMKISYLIPGIKSEEIDKRINNLNDIILNNEEFNKRLKDIDLSDFEVELLTFGYVNFKKQKEVSKTKVR